jgi:uncharacterized protein YndB with AHSA1/START domain
MAEPAHPQPPIRRSVQVSWTPAAAFHRFTAEFASWWPKHACSIGGNRVERLVFECRVGGRIYEEHRDGTRFLSGTVTALDPPTHVAFDWFSTREPADAQHVDIRFQPDGSGTRVELVSSGWEDQSRNIGGSYRGYEMAWRAVLDGYSGRYTPVRLLFNLMSVGITLTGQRGNFLRGSKGRMAAERPRTE